MGGRTPTRVRGPPPTSPPARPGTDGGWSRSRAIASPIRARSLTGPQLVGGVQAVVRGDVVEHVHEGAPAGLLGGRDLAQQQQGGDAVLVLHVLRVDAVPERLLVAEGQAGTRLIHLKPVSVSTYGCPCSSAIFPSSDDETIEQA